MPITSKHPSYGRHLQQQERCQDSYDGQDAIKNKEMTYLSASTGMIEDGAENSNAKSLGRQAYVAYLKRAVYPSIYRDAVETAIGSMFRNEPNIELPDKMKAMKECCTSDGESVIDLLRNIYAQQLINGRLGIVGDFIENEEDRTSTPIISIYTAPSIMNWNVVSDSVSPHSKRIIILDESGEVMNDDLEWEPETRYRILATVNGEGVYDPEGKFYGTAVVDDSGSLATAEFVIPNVKGTRIEKIPFEFINATDLSSEPSIPPLLGLADLCLTIYRGEADYRQNLFMQGQDTLVRIGAIHDPNEIVRTGAGARIDVPINGDAKYIGVESSGLSEQRSALENDYKRAGSKGGQLQDSNSRAKESGEALKIRIQAQTVTLPQIATAGASALESVMKTIAPWFDANPDDVVIEPNLDFVDGSVDGKTLMEIVQAKALGANISDVSIHEWMVEQGLTTRTYEEEMALIALEEPDVPTGEDDDKDPDDKDPDDSVED